MSTTRKKVLKTVAGILIFLFLLTTIINLLGPLFRPTGQDFDGWHNFYAEDNNTINAAMIGSSAMYRYWLPAQAYEEQGFTSCMISQSCQNIRAVPYIMEETLKSQDVDLFVVELRQVVVDLAQGEDLTEEEKEILTDACKIFVIKGQDVHLVEGEVFNIKITYPYDLRVAETLIKGEEK